MRAASLCLALACVVAPAACSSQVRPEPAAAQPPTSTAPGQPAGSAAPGSAEVRTVAGPVVETMDASNYTYVRVKTDSGDIWAATSQFKVAVGDRVVVPLEMENRNFHSKTLDRDFPVIYFVSRITREGESGPPPMAIGHGPSAGAPSAGGPAAVEPIGLPAGGTSVAKVWAERKALAGKMVTVRGKVVKYNGGILDRNWVHIQDGSGAAADGTNDLAITTGDVTRVGDVVTFTGRVAVDKDFSAGYVYKVMLESATLRK